MQTIDLDTAAAYLRSQELVGSAERVSVRELPGGVSNLVLFVAREPPHGDLVLKQARPQLRVADPWFCSVARIWREVEVLEICSRVLPEQPVEGRTLRVPEVVFCDRDNYLFVMTAAPPHQVWKGQLLAGVLDQAIAMACGHLLGSIHGATWQDRRVAEALDDQTFFRDLRVDPYYRHVAAQRADLRTALEEVCRSLDSERWALVHGDFSPKNLLVSTDGLLLLDFEVGHFGDPAFDLGFFLSHLLLKAIRAGVRGDGYLELVRCFCQAYSERLAPQISAPVGKALRARGIANLAACLLARVDGKSRVEYLSSAQQDLARQLGCWLLLSAPSSWDAVLAEVSANYLGES